MKKHLFLHLSFMGLMGLSTIAYGGWTKYGPNFKSGDPIPNGDCLEMICEHGCVEDDTNGKYMGYCCPSNGQCRVESGEDVALCCENGTPCIQGMCGCPTGTTEYIGIGNIKACCNNTTHKLFKIEGTTSQACCLIGTFWDATRQQCVECLTTSDCGEGQVCTSEGKCENLEGLKCTSNKECNDGSETGDYYCHVGCGGYKAGCQKISAYGMGHKAPYTWSHAIMGRSAAESWCKAQGLGLARWYHPSTVPSYINWVTSTRYGQKFQNTYMATDPTYNGSNGSCRFWLADGTYLYTCGGWQYADNDKNSGGCNAALCYGN